MEKYVKSRQMYMKYLEEVSENVFHPRINEGDKQFKKLQKECEEYAKLKFTCQRLLSEASKVIEGKTEIGQRVFMNMEVRDTKHVVVKLSEDVLVELPLQEAMKVCDRKMDMLKNLMEKIQASTTRLKAELTMLLASMDLPYTEPYRFTLPPDFPFRMEV
ncbi:hypothetical protein GCK72_014715 [Caenorhabditis remanei]|uniref:Uncharacterized protein n=2 Tax=Caenorhabditis remanei TaxID=31234 RepID=E3M6S6_CAERE|nr:hypothetical protein GCK72_014715 [Caenorhabditis remanei]EFO93190.1 hypothetical protein CRE_10009 [Caenorhabditis remanei]KAF1758257.1 hypothetical protein GCK72_014715 [Caenorhabditis remanei]